MTTPPTKKRRKSFFARISRGLASVFGAKPSRMARLIEISRALKKLGSTADQILADPDASDLHPMAEDIHKFVADTKATVETRVHDIARVRTIAASRRLRARPRLTGKNPEFGTEPG